MNAMLADTWKRRGISLLWEPAALMGVSTPAEVLSLRQACALRLAWPELLPSNQGNALVVAGLEGCLDVLAPDDADTWLRGDFRQLVLSFQDKYQGEAALVLWLPSGRKRLRCQRPTGEYSWCVKAGQETPTIPLAALFGGAEDDLARIIAPGMANADPDGDAWIGLHHPRIS